jgi:hypothetical protein
MRGIWLQQAPWFKVFFTIIIFAANFSISTVINYQRFEQRIFFLIRERQMINGMAVLMLGMLMSCLGGPAPAGKTEAAGWQKMPLLSQAQHDAGITPGGEGGQWFRDIVISKSNTRKRLFPQPPLTVAGPGRTCLKPVP